MAAMAVFVLGKARFLFIALTVEVVVGSLATDLLESVDCLLRDCERWVTSHRRNTAEIYSYGLTYLAFEWKWG